MRIHRRRFAVLIAVPVLLTAACAGAKLAQFGNLQDIPSDVPKELQAKFSVSDQSTVPEPTPAIVVTPAPTALPAKIAKKGAKGGKASPATANAPIPTPEGPFQFPSRRPSQERIIPGEKLVLQLTYFGVLAGDLELEVLPFKYVNDRKVYHMRANARSSSVFSLFYRVDDMIESFYDFNGWFSHRFNLSLDETKQTRNVVELYDSEKKQAFYWLRWNHHVKGKTETKEFFPMTPFPQDGLSAFYYLRTVQIPPKGGKILFPIVTEGKSWETEITVVRRQVLDTPIGSLKTVMLKVETRLNGVLQKTGDTNLWVTDDAWRYPVRLEAKVRIGTLVLSLKSLTPGMESAAPKIAPPGTPSETE